MAVKKKAASSKKKTKVVAKANKPVKAPEKWIRTTVMIREPNHSKIKAITYWEKKGIKEVVDDALKGYLKGIRVKPLPRKK